MCDRRGLYRKLPSLFVTVVNLSNSVSVSLCRLPAQIFKIEREGESQRYKPFRQLHNRRLLWHGSRTTNFAGILSQGLRIAPPEAPVVGGWPLWGGMEVLVPAVISWEPRGL